VGGYTYGVLNTIALGGGGAGAYFEGSLTISSDVSLTFVAGGSYKTSTITSTVLNVTAGYGGYSMEPSGNGINGSSGGGGCGSGGSTSSPGTGSSPGTTGGTAVRGLTTKAGGGGGGAGGQGGNASSNVGGAGGIGKTPTNPVISYFYTSLCVGGQGGYLSNIGATSSTYGSGGGGRKGDSTYRYGQPGAIIIAVPKT